MTSPVAATITTTMDESVLKEAGLLLKDSHATQKMGESIYNMARSLVCPLCEKVSHHTKNCTIEWCFFVMAPSL
jgi:hypothetical protein